MKYTLYNYWRSSASWRVRIGLHWKGIPFTYVPVHLVRAEQKSPEHLARNPQGSVPVLELELDDGVTRRLAQSIAILEYLEATVPTPPLLPRDPYLAARVRWLAEIVNSGIQPLQNLPVTQRIAAMPGGDAKAWARDFIEAGLLAFDEVARETAGTFCVGDAPTLADVVLVPQIYAARRFTPTAAVPPRLLEIEARCAELPAFQAAHADAQPDAVKP